MLSNILIEKRDGTIEPFSIEKLTNSIMKVFAYKDEISSKPVTISTRYKLAWMVVESIEKYHDEAVPKNHKDIWTSISIANRLLYLAPKVLDKAEADYFVLAYTQKRESQDAHREDIQNTFNSDIGDLETWQKYLSSI